MASQLITKAGNLPRSTATYELAPVVSGTASIAFSATDMKNSYLQQSQGDTSKVTLQNYQSTTSVSEKAMMSTSRIQNIYSGSGIDPLYVYPIKSGMNYYHQIQEHVKLVSGDPDQASVVLPASMSLTFKLPDGDLTAAQKAQLVKDMTERLMSLIYPNGFDDLKPLEKEILGRLDLDRM